MPAFTPNRGYPYPLAGDPAQVADALQALAEGVDADLVTLAPSIVARPIARVVRNSAINFGTVDTVANINWEQLLLNTGGAVTTFPGSPQFAVVPALPGFWFATGQMTFREAGGALPGGPIQYIDLELDWNNTRLGRQSSTARPTGIVLGSGENHTLTVGGGRLMNGTTDYFRMASTIVRPAANPNAPFTAFGASMTLWRMTQS